MNETPALPPPDQTEPAAEPPPPAAPRSRNLVPWVYALGFVVLALALLWIWQNPNPAPQRAVEPRLETIGQQLQALNERVAQLAQRPVPEPINLAPLEQRVAALEQRPAAAPDLAPIEQQLADLKSQIAAKPASAPTPDLGPLQGRVESLERQVQAAQPLKSQLDALSSQEAELGQRLAQLATDQQALASRVQDLDVAVKAQQASVGTQLQSMQQQVSTAVTAAGKAARLARLQAARAALQAGMPLGAIEGAPAALVRFAEAKPPTEAALRLAFPADAKAALDAAQPDTAGKPFGERLWQRAQELVTIREGDRVIVGDPAAGVLARAQQELDAGDLPGAVVSVSTLTGPAAQAMASWLDQAKALVAARAALDTMAAHA
jgi:hypothetical protein